MPIKSIAMWDATALAQFHQSGQTCLYRPD